MRESIPMCTTCGKRPAVVEKGPHKLCGLCAVEESKRLFAAVVGGKVIEKPEPDPVQPDKDMTIIDDHFTAPRPTPIKMPQIVGCDVVFIDEMGKRYLIRTVDSEQMEIVSRIVKNRKNGGRQFQYGEVEVVGAAHFQDIVKMTGVMVRLAATEDEAELKSIRDEAKQLLAEMEKT